MFSKSTLVSVFAALCAVSSVSAHGVLVRISGANGVNGRGFGVDPNMPRNGTLLVPFQLDAGIIRDREMASGRVGPCGRTRQHGAIKIIAAMEAATAAGLPSASSNGTVSMTIHQVNRDGAGPYQCEVSADGTGNKFKPMKIITQVIGVDGISRNTKMTAHPLVAQLPSGVKCTGGPNGNTCLVRCRNNAHNGPFGGCAAVVADGAPVNKPKPAAAATATAVKCKRSEDLLEGDDEDEDVYKRALEVVKSFEKKRALVSRIVGAARAGQWI
ncbi:hypothetical protein FRC08_003583 [Ceratobasidium sp. 394]|nr:hypothetical protein FRC08_003583 [Ceratobasidium sp. 394]